MKTKDVEMKGWTKGWDVFVFGRKPKEKEKLRVTRQST